MMNWVRNARSLLSQIATRCYDRGHAVSRLLMEDLGLIPAESAASRRRQYTTPPLPGRLVLRWYHEPRKVAAATAITLSATVMAACSRYDREIVPCTYRSHLVVYSHQEERDLSDSAVAEYKAELVQKNMLVVDPLDPRSVRVRLILDRIVHAAHRGLGIYDSSDAPMLRVTHKSRRKKYWGGKAPPPHTAHLRGINWEVILVRDRNANAGITPNGKILVNTGLLDRYKTDGEIAAVLAREVAHVIARTCGDIKYRNRLQIEADYIGILLLGAAGFHPQWALVFYQKLGKDSLFCISHPRPEKRVQLLSEANTMNQALELYREVTAMDKVTERYFR
uniref:Uncharacterized protein n=1 Tax=Avena sativa TaxID=4498 RepID=A0ACD5WE38_AVESA